MKCFPLRGCILRTAEGNLGRVTVKVQGQPPSGGGTFVPDPWETLESSWQVICKYRDSCRNPMPGRNATEDQATSWLEFFAHSWINASFLGFWISLLVPRLDLIQSRLPRNEEACLKPDDYLFIIIHV